jgi:membrane protease YdiL (CAAX protease family)
MEHPPEIVPSLKPQAQSAPAFPLRRIFFNDAELRAGWRLLIFSAVLLLTPDRAFFFTDGALCGTQSYSAKHLPKKTLVTIPAGEQPPGPFIRDDGLSFVFLLGVSAFMAIIERRQLRYFGLPLRQAFRGRFWLGCLWGFAAMSALLLVLRAGHSFYFGPPMIHGWSILRFASLWGIAFLVVGFFEEFLLRGYAQFTLTLGMGFWPAAMLLSLFFAFLHRSNPGETAFGLCQIVLIALFFCFTLWRTGTLWFAVGFHAAWDWSQSFFYGTPDSGILAKGHLLGSSVVGPAWLNGGSVGPEGSVLAVPLIALLFVLFYFAFPERSAYPDPAAIKPEDPPLLSLKTLL